MTSVESLLIMAGNSDPDPDRELAQLIRSMRSLNVLCDLFYVADAALYGGLWYRDRRLEQERKLALESVVNPTAETEETPGDDFRDMRRMMWGVSALRLPAEDAKNEDEEQQKLILNK